ncbi:IS110 family transposase [Nocardioides sp. LMS-CY]|uniref:IS110 family transposase n=1 Tax=Nocardioides sp. (strain LMS-CY) TaxID=2840457 RepID=UPI001C005F99|nr:IS110 family transposase [Nocardioides sp. LMS-CY]QWF22088.1 IS110 family transposase [Nocardioides sp. LMS-CY]QWF22996.1 IS110 family transposase [Nocardioides sp. LMS-CY]
MTSVTDLREVVDVVIGVDTHVHTHSAAAVDARTGGVLDQITVDATPDGYAQLTEFADEHATLRAWAIEGTGSFGAGLTRHLRTRDELVIELDRPVRTKRRNGAKSDPLDAIRAAREALSRTKLGGPRDGGDQAAERHSLSMLLTVRRSAVDAASDARRQLFSLVIAAPEPVRERFRGLKASAMPAVARNLRTRASWDVETRTAVTMLRTLARRIQAFTEEAAEHERAILAIVRSWRPDLLAQHGVGPIVAATVLCAWSHPGRVRSEAAFAMLAGVAPIPANSGQVTTRYRLNRRGDRQLNRALHTVALSRCRHDQRTRDYVARRTTQGKTPREIKRCLKRYIARDLYRLLQAGSTT